MKKKLIGTLCALAITVSSITPAVHAQVKTPDSLKECNVLQQVATTLLPIISRPMRKVRG